MTFCYFPTLALSADAGPMGRLFHSPEERRALDLLRRSDGRHSEIPESAATAQQITLEGIVRRSNGKTTTWINGVAHTELQATQGVKVLGAAGQAGTAAIQVASGKNIQLKAGQTYDVNSGKTRESFEKPTSP